MSIYSAATKGGAMAGAIEPAFGTRLVDAVVAVGLASALAAALSLATAFTFWVLFALGGESDVLVAYPSAVLPIVITLVLLSFVVDLTVRAAVDAAG